MTVIHRCFFLVVLACLPAALLRAQGDPVALGLQQHVDLYTGDFNYNIPLLTVTGPNGEQFPLNLNYHAGIRTNQEASWVGLGWDLSLGEISRSVNGMADDWKGKLYEKHKVTEVYLPHPIDQEVVSNVIEEASHYYGPIKFKNFNYAANSHMDLFYSNRGVRDGGGPLIYPDYDDYHVSGPGIGGQIKPYLFDHANLYLKAENGFSYGNPASPNYHRFSKQAQFRFQAEGLTEIKTPYYGAGHSSSNQINNTTHHNAGFPFEWHPSAVHLWDNGLLRPAAIANLNYDYEGDFDPTAPERQRALGGRYVEYFTNREIHEHHGPDQSKHIDGFLDFELVTTSTRNTPSDYDLDGIGAFRVTLTNGMTYHYSLPVYVDHEETRIFPFYKIGANYGIDRPGALDAIELLETNYRYAESWKLTAITGPDYEDVNGNSFPDEGDKGYWIYINYEKWNSDNDLFLDRTPFYGCHLDQTYKKVPSRQYTNLESYQLKGSVNRTYRDIYYPNYIRTATQTAFLVKTVRKDGHSAGSQLTPRLALKHVVLFDNEDVATYGIFQTYQGFTATSDFPALATVAQPGNMLHEEDYGALSASVLDKSLRTITFDQDYSLAPGVYNHVDNIVNHTSQTIGHASSIFDVYANVNSVSGTHGKLTLKQLYIYDDGQANIYNPGRAPYQFDYGTNNPAYDHRRQDFFGYYKEPRDPNNFDLNGYTTDYSKDFVDAWSLQEITTPLGGKIRVAYESDEYTKSSYNPDGYLPVTPYRTFRIDLLAAGPAPGQPSLFFTSPDAVDFFNDAGLLKEARVYYEYDCIGTGANGTASSGQMVTGTTPGNYRIDITGGLSLSTGCSHLLDPNKSGYMRFRLKKAYGGGIRVSSMRYVEPDHGEEYLLDLEYEQGQATQDPGRFAYAFNQTLRPSLSTSDRLTSAPNVAYTRVKVMPRGIVTPATEAEAVNIGGMQYTFQNWPEFFQVSTSRGARYVYSPSPPYYVTSRHYKQFTGGYFGDITSRGRIDSIIVFDEQENYLSITDHDYGITENGPVEGRIKESFFLVSSEAGSNTTVETVYSLGESHDYLTKITHTQGNFETVTRFSDFDKYTGLPNRTDVESNATGSFHTERQPAYLTYPELGPKTLDPTNENRLSVNHKVKTGRAPNSRSYTLWGDDYLVRSLNGSGAYTTASVTSGEWLPKRSFRNNGQADSSLWEPINNPTLFDSELNLLESKDAFGHYSATKLAGKNQLTIASASLANYQSFFHCGFEYVISENGQDYFESEITKGHQQQAKISSPVSIHPHSGAFMAKVDGGSWGPDLRIKRQTATVNGEVVEQGLLPGRTYEASVWVHNQSENTARVSMMLTGTAAGAPVSQHVSVSKGDGGHLTVGNWTLMRVTLTVPEDFTTPGTGDELVVFCHNYDGEDVAYFDDFRFQPIDATVEAVVYDQRRQLPLYVIGNENFYIRMEYDAAGNPVRTFQETEAGERKIQETTTHFAN